MEYVKLKNKGIEKKIQVHYLYYLYLILQVKCIYLHITIFFHQVKYNKFYLERHNNYFKKNLKRLGADKEGFNTIVMYQLLEAYFGSSTEATSYASK
jgi:hypothetical protein